MSRIVNVSSKIGEYMVAGWVLTDEPCTQCSIPMLRSPIGQTPERLLCIQCPTSPEALDGLSTKSERLGGVRERPPGSIASTSSSSNLLSRVSTPPTEVSGSPSSTTFAPPLNLQEIADRRAQSDHASAEIGRRMLQGWAMLAEECPNDSCYGVPLVRPPKPGGAKDPRKECVICGEVYVFEKNSRGSDVLVPLKSVEVPSSSQSRYAHDPRTDHISGTSVPKVVPQHISNNETVVRPENSVHEPMTSDTTTLDASEKSLDRALAVLSNRLTVLSIREIVDYIAVGELATSMERVANALRAKIASRMCAHSATLSHARTCANHVFGGYHEVLGCISFPKNQICSHPPHRSGSTTSEKKERNEPARYDTRAPWYDSYDQSRVPIPSESRWRNVLTKRRPPRNEYHENESEYYEQDIRTMRHPSQRPTVVEDYDSQESMTTDSENYPIRHPMPEPHTRFIERMPSYESLPPEPPEHYVSRIPSHETLSARPLQSSLDQSQSGEQQFAPPADEMYMEEPVAPSTYEGTVARESEPPPVFHAEPRRFRARRGEPITVGNTRIEVEDDGGQDSHRRGRSRSRSTVSYNSYSSRSYSSSSFDERPIIISADPHTQIEIGNEQDGFVPYEQYLAERESRRRRRRHRHRDTPEEEIYVVPAGANVIFVDEDGNELHRVGEFDDRYNNRRRNTSARTTRQADGSYLIEF